MRHLVADLIAHKNHANAATLAAIGDNAAAAADAELLDMLHHVLLANRFWLLAVRSQPFVYEEESRRSPSFEDLVARYARLQAEEATWLAAASDEDLGRTIESPQIPGGRCSVTQAWLQVCLHSHGHRAQLAKLLRRHGGEPPAADFILWLATRPAPRWEGASTP
jgi:uncharacterized damage-inducible protein DinB